MEQPQLTPEAPPEVPPSRAMSLGGRLLNVFATPGDVFQEAKSAANTTANWLAPALILIVVSWVAAWVIFSQDSIKHQLSELTDQAIQKQIDSARLSENQAEQAHAMGEKWAGLSSKIGAALAPVFVGFITPFLWGLIVWLLGTQLFKGHFSYTKAAEVVGLANMISVLDVIVRTLLIVGFGNLYASPGLVLLVKDFDPQNPVHAAMGAVNVMTFWLLMVRAISLARLSGASLTKADTGLFIGLGALLQAGVQKMSL
jgi:hypothetical protein